jgi:hypothetical protein
VGRQNERAARRNKWARVGERWVEAAARAEGGTSKQGRSLIGRGEVESKRDGRSSGDGCA